MGGCGSLENSPHLFLQCHFFGEVWHLIYHWLGVCSVIPSEPADYLNQFGVVGGNCSKMWRSILLLIWYATMWEICKERNYMILNDKQCSTLQLVDKIKALSFV